MDTKRSRTMTGKKRGHYNMKVSMSAATKGIKKNLTLEGCIKKWVAKEHKKEKEN